MAAVRAAPLRTPVEDLPAAMAAYYWRTRAEFAAQHWVLDLVVRVDGQIVGTQGLSSHGYLTHRRAETGSWLGRAHQGHGIGTLMRQAICALAFDHFDAVEIMSGAYTDNPRPVRSAGRSVINPTG